MEGKIQTNEGQLTKPFTMTLSYSLVDLIRPKLIAFILLQRKPCSNLCHRRSFSEVFIVLSSCASVFIAAAELVYVPIWE